MFAEVMRNNAYRAYRAQLEELLQIPTTASDQGIHALIEAGFSAERVMRLCELGELSPEEFSHIMSFSILGNRLSLGEPLTVAESDRLFRLVHIVTMAEVLFGNRKKARRWLSKSKERFSGEKPIALLSTSQGTRLVEEMLIQVSEGQAF
jgi:putative toxin-antitoxin system antitoxin component (TIGR02293 family)